MSDILKVGQKAPNIEAETSVGKRLNSARRVTFLIDKAGVVRHIWEKTNAAKHADEVLEKVQELSLSDLRL